MLSIEDVISTTDADRLVRGEPQAPTTAGVISYSQASINRWIAAGTRWKYYSAHSQRWEDLTVIDDGTLAFTRAGIVKLQLPLQMQPTNPFNLRASDGSTQPLYWLAVEAPDIGLLYPVEVQGIYPNAVMAYNARRIDREILGSSHGDPNLVLSFDHAPVLAQPRPMVEVRAPSKPTEEEIAALQRQVQAESPKEVLRIETDGATTHYWVRWIEVPNFAQSHPTSRHYMLDYAKGHIQFGDGQHGMVPPAGTIFQLGTTPRRWRGNVLANTLTSRCRPSGITMWMPLPRQGARIRNGSMRVLLRVAPTWSKAKVAP